MALLRTEYLPELFLQCLASSHRIANLLRCAAQLLHCTLIAEMAGIEIAWPEAKQLQLRSARAVDVVVHDVTLVRELAHKSLDGRLSEQDAEILLSDLHLVQVYGQSDRVDWLFFGEEREPNVFSEAECADQADRVRVKRPRPHESVYREDAEGLDYCWPSPPFEPTFAMSLAHETADCRAMYREREDQFVQLLRATRYKKSQSRRRSGDSAHLRTHSLFDFPEYTELLRAFAEHAMYNEPHRFVERLDEVFSALNADLLPMHQLDADVSTISGRFPSTAALIQTIGTSLTADTVKNMSCRQTLCFGYCRFKWILKEIFWSTKISFIKCCICTRNIQYGYYALLFR